MSHHEIGLGIQSDKRPGAYAAIAQQAEASGIDVLSVYGDLMFQPPITALLEMAVATDRIRLGPACLNPYSMHPYEIAGQIATLDLVSGGRAYLGLARGSWLDAVGIDQSSPLTYLEEAVQVVRSLWAGDDAGFTGNVFRLEPGTRLAYDTARARVPVLIGAWGPRTLALAGRIADEVKIGGSANPAMIGVARERLGDAGGNVAIVVGAVSVVDEDGIAARRLARREVAMYLDVVGALDPTIDVDPDALEHIRRHVAAGDPEVAGEAVSDAVLDRFALAGTPDGVAEHVAALFAAGATRVELGTPHGLSTSSGIDLIGTRVLPVLA